MKLNSKLFNDIVTNVMPFMELPDERQAFVKLALYECAVLNQIHFSGSPNVFTAHLIDRLVKFGYCGSKPALIALLEHCQSNSGQPVWDDLISQVENVYNPQATKNTETQFQVTSIVNESNTEETKKRDIVAIGRGNLYYLPMERRKYILSELGQRAKVVPIAYLKSSIQPNWINIEAETISGKFKGWIPTRNLKGLSDNGKSISIKELPLSRFENHDLEDLLKLHTHLKKEIRIQLIVFLILIVCASFSCYGLVQPNNGTHTVLTLGKFILPLITLIIFNLFLQLIKDNPNIDMKYLEFIINEKYIDMANKQENFELNS